MRSAQRVVKSLGISLRRKSSRADSTRRLNIKCSQSTIWADLQRNKVDYRICTSNVSKVSIHGRTLTILTIRQTRSSWHLKCDVSVLGRVKQSRATCWYAYTYRPISAIYEKAPYQLYMYTHISKAPYRGLFSVSVGLVWAYTCCTYTYKWGTYRAFSVNNRVQRPDTPYLRLPSAYLRLSCACLRLSSAYLRLPWHSHHAVHTNYRVHCSDTAYSRLPCAYLCLPCA